MDFNEWKEAVLTLLSYSRLLWVKVILSVFTWLKILDVFLAQLRWPLFFIHNIFV